MKNLQSSIISHLKHFVNQANLHHLKPLLPAFLVSLILAPSALALSESTLDFYDNNNIFYYNPEGGYSDSCEYGLANYDGIASAGLSSLQSEFVDKYHDIAIKLGAEYGIPWETVMAQGILESAAGTSHYARTRNNFFGIGAWDGNPDNASFYPSPTAGWRGYFENIRKTSVYRKNGAFNYANDPYGYAVAIKKAGYATDPNYVKKLTGLIKAVEHRATTKDWTLSRNLPSNQGPLATPGSQNASSVLYTHECANLIQTPLNPNLPPKIDYSPLYHHPSNPTINRQNNSRFADINTIGLALSWSDRSHHPNDPKPSYRQALVATGTNRGCDRCTQLGKSCDVFVATVLRYSGADPNVPYCGARNMMNYFLAHPELYERIPNTGSTSNLLPGDIRSNAGHVELIVKTPGSSALRIASASHCQRTADHGVNFYPDRSYLIFRRK